MTRCFLSFDPPRVLMSGTLLAAIVGTLILISACGAAANAQDVNVAPAVQRALANPCVERLASDERKDLI
jgi:hypothetical protein